MSGHKPLRSAYGSASVEAFMLIAILTILLTRAYLQLTGYPSIGGATLHIAHALWGAALMMLAIVIWASFIGFGVRALCIVLGGAGFGLFLDEVGKFITRDNDYFYGPAAEVMYIVVVLILVFGRIVRDVRPQTTAELVANAAAIAADGVAHGLPPHRRDWAMRMLDTAHAEGADPVTVESIRTLLERAPESADKLRRAVEHAPRLIPDFFRHPRWLPIVGWLMVLAALGGLAFGWLGVALGGYFYENDKVTFELAGMTPATAILLVSATITFGLALPAMVAMRRTDDLWPLRLLRTAALIFTMLNALVDFATQGFAALLSLGIGLFTLAIITYQINVRTESPELAHASGGSSNA